MSWSEATARAKGFTESLVLERGLVTLDLLIEPGTGTDGIFIAYCRDTGELLRVRPNTHCEAE